MAEADDQWFDEVERDQFSDLLPASSGEGVELQRMAFDASAALSEIFVGIRKAIRDHSKGDLRSVQLLPETKGAVGNVGLETLYKQGRTFFMEVREGKGDQEHLTDLDMVQLYDTLFFVTCLWPGINRTEFESKVQKKKKASIPTAPVYHQFVPLFLSIMEDVAIKTGVITDTQADRNRVKMNWMIFSFVAQGPVNGYRVFGRKVQTIFDGADARIAKGTAPPSIIKVLCQPFPWTMGAAAEKSAFKTVPARIVGGDVPESWQAGGDPDKLSLNRYAKAVFPTNIVSEVQQAGNSLPISAALSVFGKFGAVNYASAVHYFRDLSDTVGAPGLVGAAAMYLSSQDFTFRTSVTGMVADTNTAGYSALTMLNTPFFDHQDGCEFMILGSMVSTVFGSVMAPTYVVKQKRSSKAERASMKRSWIANGNADLDQAQFTHISLKASIGAMRSLEDEGETITGFAYKIPNNDSQDRFQADDGSELTAHMVAMFEMFAQRVPDAKKGFVSSYFGGENANDCVRGIIESYKAITDTLSDSGVITVQKAGKTTALLAGGWNTGGTFEDTEGDDD